MPPKGGGPNLPCKSRIFYVRVCTGAAPFVLVRSLLERSVVELALVGEHVAVGVRGCREVALPTCSPIRAQGTRPRCSSEIRRCRRSCGENAGTPAHRLDTEA